MVDLGLVRNASPLVHAILALTLLLMATVLGVYKPLGMTAYGKRKQDEQNRRASVTGAPRPTAAGANPTATTRR